MNNVRRNVFTLAVTLAMTLVGGCTFGTFAREPREPRPASIRRARRESVQYAVRAASGQRSSRGAASHRVRRRR